MFIAGANTGMDLVQHAVNRLGAGDLSILAERAAYAKRAEIGDVRIWTRDAQLSAYEWPEHWT